MVEAPRYVIYCNTPLHTKAHWARSVDAHMRWLFHFKWGVIEIRTRHLLSHWLLIPCQGTNSTKNLNLWLKHQDMLYTLTSLTNIITLIGNNNFTTFQQNVTSNLHKLQIDNDYQKFNPDLATQSLSLILLATLPKLYWKIFVSWLTKAERSNWNLNVPLPYPPIALISIHEKNFGHLSQISSH